MLNFSFYIICLSETYLNFQTIVDDPNLNISSCNVFCVNYPSSNKREMVYTFLAQDPAVMTLEHQ